MRNEDYRNIVGPPAHSIFGRRSQKMREIEEALQRKMYEYDKCQVCCTLRERLTQLIALIIIVRASWFNYLWNEIIFILKLLLLEAATLIMPIATFGTTRKVVEKGLDHQLVDWLELDHSINKLTVVSRCGAYTYWITINHASRTSVELAKWFVYNLSFQLWRLLKQCYSLDNHLTQSRASIFLDNCHFRRLFVKAFEI